MVRAPCCEKMGLKKGPWSSEEDQILVSFIQKHGHENWRALPKQAGLLRCGKSCRLRWTNYLRPDIKRGNFSNEEEQTIIELHEKLGNRWSAIAAKLPGRTDNEIKNVWHTNIKKKLKDHQPNLRNNSKRHTLPEIPQNDSKDSQISKSDQSTTNVASPQPCTSEMSSVTDSSCERILIKNEQMDYSSEYLPKIDESFWLEELSIERMIDEKILFDFPLMENMGKDIGKVDEDMDFWYNLFIRAGDNISSLLEI